MNLALLIILLIVAVVLWFLLSFLFKPVGKLTYRVYKDAVDEINKNDDEKQEKSKNEQG